MNKKTIIITAALGLFSFAAAFFVSYMMSKKASAKLAESMAAEQESAPPMTEEEKLNAAMASTAIASPQTTLVLTERHLKNLIFDVQDKINEYKQKLAALQNHEERLKVSQQQLEKDISELTALRTEVASMVANLKQERDLLLKTRIEIQESEKANIMLIAATYDKMNATNAGDIFVNMSKISEPPASGIRDVVKILYYMNDRAKAKVLAELVNTEPQLAAVLSQELKKIREVVQ